MEIPQDILDCVVFVYYKVDDAFKKAGTAFLISKPVPGFDPDAGPRAAFVVTAHHVIAKIKKNSSDSRVYLRLNTHDQGLMYVSSGVEDWHTHPSKNVDLAVGPGVLGDHFKQGYIKSESMLSQERIAELRVGPGDDLFFPGLFVHHPGESKNVPIIRTGTIAAMPGEPIATSTQGLLDAYLIEARSIGGLSGSPVFLHLSGPRVIKAGAWNQFYLLGVIQGHYDVRDVLDETDNDITVDLRTRSINFGIALVTPVADLDAILELPEFVEWRRQLAEKELQRRAEGGPPDD